ncbi:LytTR family DNA-binding domain-containing protein [Undibacterium sp. TS12]|uniref:LytR/AlgR family response regulator transcription factor n=1 Tax=Undibacterium sp. TS12 TaxID=2908202 RepID=UPI001F4CE04D|nr:LytTR family DNA-binding domain-containing protein [Undibacterium sp. TS12]MCH8619647.1 LytTR family DNA-binding domain-containing protein [Undibacterium sp. TS12]
MNLPGKASPRALIAEDETILRDELQAALARLWPELEVVAAVDDGITAAQAIADLQPDLAFLDVRMPGLTGIDVARLASQNCHIVFLTAHNDYAIDAFDQGAVDYLLKPLDVGRLALAVQRLKQRLTQQPADLSALQIKKPDVALRWIQASVGQQIRFINVSDVLCFRADAKYTKVLTGKLEAHIRTTIKDLAVQLDGDRFWQISRSNIVNVAAIAAVQRVDGGLSLRLENEMEWLAVSQPYQFQFRQM